VQTYISCNALVVLGGPNDLLQTIYHTEEELRAVAIDKSSGKIATCTNKYLYIYNTFGHDEGALKVRRHYDLQAYYMNDTSSSGHFNIHSNRAMGAARLAVSRGDCRERFC